MKRRATRSGRMHSSWTSRARRLHRRGPGCTVGASKGDVMKLEGEVVLITGGGSGIGLALGRGLLAKKNTVIVSGRNAHKLAQAKEANPGLHVVEHDVCSEASSRAVLERVVKDHGRLS